MRRQTHSFIHNLWAPRATTTCGGFERDAALTTAEETGQIIGFGQLFLANVSLRRMCDAGLTDVCNPSSRIWCSVYNITSR